MMKDPQQKFIKRVAEIVGVTHSNLKRAIEIAKEEAEAQDRDADQRDEAPVEEGQTTDDKFEVKDPAQTVTDEDVDNMQHSEDEAGSAE